MWGIPEQAPLDTLAQNLATIRAAAVAAGRDPDTIRVALRLNPAPGVSVETIAEHVRKTVPELGADETFVDLHMLSSTVDDAIDLAGQVLELVNKGRLANKDKGVVPMTDYGHDLRFGSFLTPHNHDPHHVVDLAVFSEQVGLDLATFQDHPYQPALLDT